MKNTIKKLMAVLLSLVIAFSVANVPASAVNVYEENTFSGLIEVYDYGNEEDKNFFEKIVDLFHWYIARIFCYFDADCPICGEHFMMPNLEYDIEYYYNDAINTLKDYKGKVTVEKKRTVNVAIGDAPNFVLAILEPIAENIVGTTSNTYTFLMGKDIEGRKITDVVQPLGRNAEITKAGTASSFAITKDFATAIEGLSVCIISETSRFDGTTVTEPVYNSSIIEPVNLATLELGPLKIIEAELRYPETGARVIFDDEGRIETLTISIPVYATFTGNVAMIKFTTDCRAEITEEYTITYA